MVFEVPAAKAEERFEFKIKGRKYAVPMMKNLPGEVVEMLAAAQERGGLSAQAAQYAIFGKAGTPVGDAVRTLDSEQIDALTDAYVAASRVSVGESSASTDS